jgi:hypothetical protein
MTQTNQALAWGESKGEAAKNGLPFMKFQKDNQFRIISGIVPRYVYWVNNAEGKPRTFECLAFNRQSERFENSNADPIREAGLKQKGEGKDAGKMIPLKCKRAYVCLAINRATNKVEAIDLKKSIFDGTMDTAGQLGKSPLDFDIFVQKTGTTWTDTKYTVQQLKCGSYTQTAEEKAEDQKLIDECDDISSLFPRQTYEEVKAGLASWLAGEKEEKEDNSDSGSQSGQEAINELED